LALDADVIVVGAAVAGLAVANALGELGVRTLVLEKGPERDNSTRGDILHPPTLRFLERWGVLEGLHADGALPMTHIAVSHRDLGRLATYAVPAQADGPAGRSLAVPHDRIEAVMKDSAERWPSVSVERALAVDLARDQSGRVTGVQARVGEEERVFTAALVVGCDGMSSMVRRRSGIGVEQYRYPHQFVFVTAEGTTDPPAAMHFHLSDRVVLVANRPRNRMRVAVRFEPGEGRELFRDPDPALHDFIRKRVPPLESVRFVGSDVHVYPIVRQLAERFCAPGLVLVGDAAHTTHPAGATGMNLAITGASRLAELVRMLLDDRRLTTATASALDQALLAYDAERRPAAAAAIAENHRQAMRIWDKGVENDPHAFAAAANPTGAWGVRGAGWGQNPAALSSNR
jgi:2-polyprenyl-6-methoxyphenol hydroxylase-like FAD-dependent oxidoreductase